MKLDSVFAELGARLLSVQGVGASFRQNEQHNGKSKKAYRHGGKICIEATHIVRAWCIIGAGGIAATFFPSRAMGKLA